MTVTRIDAEILVAGGGLGGVAAALAACRKGRRVVLTEETHWLGGQATSQGVSALDEHNHIETFGGTASYYEWREAIRDYYRQRLTLSDEAEAAPFFNPGDGWVSRCCFEPRVGVITLLDLLKDFVADGQLQIHYDAHVLDADVEAGRCRACASVSPATNGPWRSTPMSCSTPPSSAICCP